MKNENKGHRARRASCVVALDAPTALDVAADAPSPAQVHARMSAGEVHRARTRAPLKAPHLVPREPHSTQAGMRREEDRADADAQTIEAQALIVAVAEETVAADASPT